MNHLTDPIREKPLPRIHSSVPRSVKDILNVNGSAVDAAIAAMFCLGVVSMHSSGIGGGGVMLLYNQTLKKATVIDFREIAPATAYWDVFRGREEEAKKGLNFCLCMILL